MFKINDVVTIRAGLSHNRIGSGIIKQISPTGKRLTVLRRNIKTSFYRSSDGTRYVQNPGAGSFGNMLNDYIAIPAPEAEEIVEGVNDLRRVLDAARKRVDNGSDIDG
jgi:hypothetical protein